MVTKNLSNDFMAKVLEDAAWKELSGDFAWNEQLLEKYKDKVQRAPIYGRKLGEIQELLELAGIIP